MFEKNFGKSIHQSNTKLCGSAEKWLKFVRTVLISVSMWCQLVIWSAIPVLGMKISQSERVESANAAD